MTANDQIALARSMYHAAKPSTRRGSWDDLDAHQQGFWLYEAQNWMARLGENIGSIDDIKKVTGL